MLLIEYVYRTDCTNIINLQYQLFYLIRSLLFIITIIITLMEEQNKSERKSIKKYFSVKDQEKGMHIT